jgi:osmotically-inducible protein OsmY
MGLSAREESVMKSKMKNVRWLRTSFVLLIGSFLIGSCTRQSAAAVPTPKDDTITARINTALSEDPRVAAAEITASTQKGIVKLSGTAYDLAEERYAVREAKKFDGVRGVIDEINVTPMQRSDSDIDHDIRWRLNNDGTIVSKGLHVSVMDGTATLTGAVSSWEERQEAQLVATEVAGIKKVVNELRVEYATHRSDEAIQRDVSAALGRDVYLTGLPVVATVNDGVVTLEGTVGSAYQKERAKDDARWIQNVRSVKNGLRVEWWEKEGVRKNVPSPSDADLEKAVTDELYQDFRIVAPFEVTAQASYGHVTLHGSLPTYHEKELAEEDARDIVGVAWVTNLVTVNTDYRSDKDIRQDIQFDISSDYLLKDKPVQFGVKDGVVTLTGQVSTWYEKNHAKELASRVPGVKEVLNEVTVEWYARYTDQALRDQIKDHLMSNSETRFVADLIQVNVKNGEAKLTGDVNSWAERREAGRVALVTNGIKVVDNRLTVVGVDYPWDEWHYRGETAQHSSFDEYDLHARLP